ncbi:MAG: MBL fold metallo-hydrolase [Acidobacteria bacterium]|nr:MBL fold metallo-hydrolase [Acidobacteriota bacterium]
MARSCVLILLLVTVLAAPAAAKGLEIYFIDVEGGQATLIVTPAGQSLLIDAGFGRTARNPTSRDPDRILAAARDAGIGRIDFLLITHFHGDHVGGVPELASRIPIGTFVDYGGPLGTIYGPDRMTVRGFSNYEPVRAQGRHLQPEPGDRLPLLGIEADVVSAGGALLSAPLPGGGESNGACDALEDHPEDGTENFRSLGIVLRYGAFSFVNLGDLSGNTLPKLVCPRNLLGKTSAYLISHHGDYDTNTPAVYAALTPRVAVMNNGPSKGGDPATVKTVQAQPGLDLWQLHASEREGARNAPDDFIANVQAENCDGYWIKLTANDDGSFSLVNGRTGFTRAYPAGLGTD